MLKYSENTLWVGCWGILSFSCWFCGCSALLYNLILLPEAETDLAGKEMSVDGFRALPALSAKAQVYFESPSLCQDQPIMWNSRESKCVPVSGWNVKGPGVCVHFFTAVCEPSCGLYGTCVEPNKCQCKEGWHGRHCNKSKWETNPESHIQGVTHPMLCRNDCLKSLSSFTLHSFFSNP